MIAVIQKGPTPGATRTGAPVMGPSIPVIGLTIIYDHRRRSGSKVLLNPRRQSPPGSSAARNIFHSPHSFTVESTAINICPLGSFTNLSFSRLMSLAAQNLLLVCLIHMYMYWARRRLGPRRLPFSPVLRENKGLPPVGGYEGNTQTSV